MPAPKPVVLALFGVLVAATSAWAQATAPAAGDVLVLDVGGTYIKAARFSNEGRELEFRRVPTPPNVGPDQLVATLKGLYAELRGPVGVRAVAVGFPGPVRNGRVLDAPNLDAAAWRNGGKGVGLQRRLARVLGIPTKVVNDAVMASYEAARGEKGRSLWLGLGTGVGMVMVDGAKHIGLEMAHHPFRLGAGQRVLSYEEVLGDRGLRGGPGREVTPQGTKLWLARLGEALVHLDRTFRPDQFVVVGGNAKHLADEAVRRGLPFAEKLRIGDAKAGAKGGYYLLRGVRSPRR